MLQERKNSFVSEIIPAHPTKTKNHILNHHSLLRKVQLIKTLLDNISKTYSTKELAAVFLKELGQVLNGEICLLCEGNDDNTVNLSQCWSTPQQSSHPILTYTELTSSCFPKEYCETYDFELLSFPFLNKLKPISNSLYKYWRAQGLKSIIFLPIWQNQSIRGWLIIGSFSKTKEWSSISPEALKNIQGTSEEVLQRVMLEHSIRSYQDRTFRNDGTIQYQTPTETELQGDMRWVANHTIRPIYFN